MPSAAPGLEFSAPRLASGWMRVGNGRTSYGRNCAPNAESNCFFRSFARAPGFLNAAMAWRVAFIGRDRLILARADRLRGGDRFPGAQIIRGRMNTLISGGGFAAYLYGWGGANKDMAFSQDTSLSGQLSQRWKLRKMAQEAALQEIASSRLLRLLAFNESLACTNVKIGERVLCFKAPNKEAAPRRGGEFSVISGARP